jgi:hypothetical protein
MLASTCVRFRLRAQRPMLFSIFLTIFNNYLRFSSRKQCCGHFLIKKRHFDYKHINIYIHLSVRKYFSQKKNPSIKIVPDCTLRSLGRWWMVIKCVSKQEGFLIPSRDRFYDFKKIRKKRAKNSGGLLKMFKKSVNFFDENRRKLCS